MWVGLFYLFYLLKPVFPIPQAEFEDTLCSACGVVSQEILLALEREVHRFKKRSVSSQKIEEIEVKMSEWQMITMLDGVCEHMKNYTLIQRDGSPQYILLHKLGANNNIASGIQIDGLGDKLQNFNEISGNYAMSGESKYAHKRLRDYCLELLEDYEDTIVSEILTMGRSPIELAQTLCVDQSKVCNDKSSEKKTKKMKERKKAIKDEIISPLKSEKPKKKKKKKNSKRGGGLDSGAIPGN